jgi:hypothetical protein
MEGSLEHLLKGFSKVKEHFKPLGSLMLSSSKEM